MKRTFDAFLGKNSAWYGRDVIQGLRIKEPPVDEYEVADFLGYTIEEFGKDELADFLEYKNKEDSGEKVSERRRLLKILQTACAHLFRDENLILVNRDMYPLRISARSGWECECERIPTQRGQ